MPILVEDNVRCDESCDSVNGESHDCVVYYTSHSVGSFTEYRVPYGFHARSILPQPQLLSLLKITTFPDVVTKRDVPLFRSVVKSSVSAL